MACWKVLVACLRSLIWVCLHMGYTPQLQSEYEFRASGVPHCQTNSYDLICTVAWSTAFRVFTYHVFLSGAVLASFFPDQSLIVTQSRRNQTTSKEESGACSQLANSLPKEFDRIEACGDWLFQILNLFRSFFTYLAVLKRHKSGSRCKMLLLEGDSGHFRAPKRRGHWIEENRRESKSRFKFYGAPEDLSSWDLIFICENSDSLATKSSEQWNICCDKNITVDITGPCFWGSVYKMQ
jgi:hypothetical protein